MHGLSHGLWNFPSIPDSRLLSRRCFHRLYATYDLGRGVPLHFPDQHRLLTLFRHHLRVGKRNDAAQCNFIGRDEFDAFAVYEPEGTR